MTASAPKGAAVAWGRTPIVVRAGVVVLLAVLAVQLVSGLVSGVVGARMVPQAPTSPYASGPEGTEGLVRLLGRVADVTVATASLTPGAVPAGSTLLVIDPLRWTAQDRATAASVVRQGGDVEFVGAAPPNPGPVLAAGSTVTFEHVDAGPVLHVLGGPLTKGVAALVTGTGALRTTGAVVDDVTGTDGTFVASDASVVWVGSSAPFRNGDLAARDDAALAWNLAGVSGGRVVLDAADMTPLATVGGIRALPSWWQGAILVAVLAMGAWVLSASRRFGPIMAAERELAPARIGHVDAVAADLAALPSRHVASASAPVARAARRALLRRLHRTEHDGDEGIDKDASERGVPEWVVRAATNEPATRSEAVETARALAWLCDQGGTR